MLHWKKKKILFSKKYLFARIQQIIFFEYEQSISLKLRFFFQCNNQQIINVLQQLEGNNNCSEILIETRTKTKN